MDRRTRVCRSKAGACPRHAIRRRRRVSGRQSHGASTGSTIHTVLSVPLPCGNESIGAILLRRTEVRQFNDKQITLLSTFADQAVIAIQNARLFNETREALERQTATTEMLNVIASSPIRPQPVFEAISAERSEPPCRRRFTHRASYRRRTSHLEAFTPTTPEADRVLDANFPFPAADCAVSVAQSGEVTHFRHRGHDEPALAI